MRAVSMMRFVVLGAVGFGIAGAIGSPLITFLPGGVALLIWPLVGGAVGGASLGLALKEWRRVVVLALLGALGLFVGVFAVLTLGSFFNYFELLIAAIVGAAVGASLGVAFRDWRMIVALAVAGAVGFSVGNLPADFIRFSIPIIRQLGQAGSIATIGVIGGAALGATLGYLENRKLVEERRQRVRRTSSREDSTSRTLGA
jgi:hypothetical protein